MRKDIAGRVYEVVNQQGEERLVAYGAGRGANGIAEAARNILHNGVNGDVLQPWKRALFLRVEVPFDEDADTGGNSTYFRVKFFGQDAQVLKTLAEEAERRLETVEGVQDISSSFNRP